MKVLDILEARSPKINYKNVDKRGKLDRVIAELTNQQGSAFTKMAQQYRVISLIEKRIKAKKDEYNKNAKGKVDDLFDVADQLVTRSVETASLLLTVGRAETRTTEHFDREAFMEEVIKLVPALEMQLKALEKQFINSKTTNVSPKLTTKLKDSQYNEDVGSIGKIVSYFKRWMTRWDRKFNKLKRQLPR